MVSELVKIKKNVLKLNLRLKTENLIIQNFGNASIRFEDQFIIKPSGINLNSATYEDMVKVEINRPNEFKNLKPSVDYPTHRVLYEKFPEINSIIHTHSIYATAFAQAECEIKNLGTTHSDFAYGSIPLSRKLLPEEISINYEENTGLTFIELIENNYESCFHIPGILAIKHGVFAWGKDDEDCFKNAEIIEFLAKLNYITYSVNSSTPEADVNLQNKHFFRKHGPSAYYGQ